jgi:peroxiredoxin
VDTPVHDPYTLPSDLPVPTDDGRAAHLPGRRLPPVALPASDGTVVNLSTVPGRAVLFAFPRTSRPGEQPLVADWDAVPGARGCTPHTCGYRDLAADFAAHGCRVFGLSAQSPEDLRELAERLHLPFPVLSDAAGALTEALQLPTLVVAGRRLLARLAWVQDAGTLTHVFYPVFPPNRNAAEVLAWVAAHPVRLS